MNGGVLGVSAVWVIIEAIHRISNPPPVAGPFMLATATLGLVVNLAAAYVLGSGKRESNANVSAAYAHVLADAAGSVAAIVAGIFVTVFHLAVVDPIASILISVLILWGAWGLIRGSVNVLMETAPHGVRLRDVEATIRAVSGVSDLHDLHVWSISEGFPVVTVHVMLDGTAHGTDVARRVSERIRDAHGIEHVTVQPEPPNKSRLISKERLLRRESKSDFPVAKA